MSRTFHDSDGREWEILQITRRNDHTNAVRNELADGWFLFQRHDGWRVRVAAAHVPANWEQLSDAELEQLLSRGLPVSSDAPGVLRPNEPR